jgi:hypothetical protein
VTDLLANAFEVPSNSPATKKFAWSGFRHPLDTYFVGREDELAKLQGYQSNERIKVAVISGLGGMGKSLLAFQYAKGKKNSSNCVWLRGEYKDTLLNSVNNVARELKLQTNNSNGTQEQFEEMLVGIRSKININDQPWLIILDNVDLMHEFVTPTINAVSSEPNVFIIVTSVLRKVASKRKTAVLLELSGFSDGDADKFIKERLDNSKAELNRELSAALQSLPLAMEQAMEYIVDQSNNSLTGKAYGIEEFVEEFNNQKSAMEILDYKLEENEKTIFTTVKMCSERIQALEDGEDTYTLLHILSYLDPDGVPRSFLEGLIRVVEDTVEFLEKRLTVLKDYSLITVENEEITIHRVVQRIVPLIQLATAQSLLKRVAVGTFKSLSNLNDNLFHEREKRQLTIVWNHFKKADNLICSISDYQCNAIDEFLLKIDSSLLFVQGHKDTLAYLGNLLGDQEYTTHLLRTYFSSTLNDFKGLIQLENLQTGLAELTNKHGEDHPYVLSIRGIIIHCQHSFKMDVNYFEELSRLIAIADKKLEKCHPCTLNMKFRLAACLYEDQKYTHALNIAKDLHLFMKASDPLYFPMGNLQVNCYKALGDVVRASELHEEYSRKRDALRMETRPTDQNVNSCADEEAEFDKDFLHLKILFPELNKLRSELLSKVDNTHQRIETRSSIVEQQNHTGTSDANRSEAEICQEMLQTLSSVIEAETVTINRCRRFFTHERNFLKAQEILNGFLDRLKISMIRELAYSD